MDTMSLHAFGCQFVRSVVADLVLNTNPTLFSILLCSMALDLRNNDNSGPLRQNGSPDHGPSITIFLQFPVTFLGPSEQSSNFHRLATVASLGLVVVSPVDKCDGKCKEML